MQQPTTPPKVPTSPGEKLAFWPVDTSRVRVGPKYMGHWKFGTYRHGYGYHTGVDFLGPVGLKVVASFDGVVTSSTPTASRWGYGHNVVIRHTALGLESRYSHLDSRLVKAGQVVKAGEQIGRLGLSGTDNAHLHWDVIKLPLPNPRFNPHNPLTGGVQQPLVGLDPVEEALVRKYFADGIIVLNAVNARNPVTGKAVRL